MTNVRASNLHPTFLAPARYPPTSWAPSSLLTLPRRLLVGAAPRRRPSFAPLTAAPSLSLETLNLQVPSATLTLVSVVAVCRGERVERPSSRRFGKLPRFLSCGRIFLRPTSGWKVVRIYTRAIEMTFAGLERGLATRRGSFQFAARFEARRAKPLSVLCCRKKRI